MNILKHIIKLPFLLMGLTAVAQIDPSGIGVIVTNEATINSDKLEYSPAFYEDGVVFISTNFQNKRYKVKDKRIDKNIMSIYWAQRDSAGVLTAPVPFAGELLTKVHEGPLTFDRTGESMFFTRNNNEKGKRKISSNGISKLKIYSAIKFRDSWTAIEDLPFNDPESNTCHPAISVEGDKIYFASDREGGQGGMDLYVVRRKGDSWGEPVNLGPSVNTAGNEAFPFIHADGTLYFASDGHPGQGGFDLFYALEEGSGFAAPVNLKAPFNTTTDDFGLIIDRDKRNGYFSSSRQGGLGEDDIYSFNLTGNTSLVGDPTAKELSKTKVWFILKDKFSGELIPDARVTAMNLSLASDNVVTENAAKIGNYIPIDDAYNQILLQLEIDSSDVFGQTDMEGRIPLVLIGEENVINITKKGYQNKQLVLSQYADGEEVYVELETINDPIPFTGEVLDVLGQPMAGAVVIIEDEDKTTKDQIKVGPDGKFSYMLGRNKLYNVMIVQDGKEVRTHKIGSIDSDANAGMPMSMTFDLAKDEVLGLQEGLVVELPNIYYNFNDASIRPDARKDLDRVVELMNNYTS
ncbi:MAG: hypothetical protein AAFO94_04515, partial [Bacteroidota bacterium]